jgi:hypothetical protein
MSLVKIQGNASGTGEFTIAAPNSNTNYTLTLPTATGTIITTAGGAAISGTTGAFTTTVGVGGATPAASGAGITFPATASASSDANTLDDYEEGTFTPIISGESVAGTGTYSTQFGEYTKIGRTVYFRIYLSWSAHTGTGNAIVSSLPFTAINTGDLTPVTIAADNYTFSNTLTAWVRKNTQQIAIGQFSSGGAIDNVAIDSAANLYISGCYNV